MLAVAEAASRGRADTQSGAAKPGGAFLPTRHAGASGTSPGKCAGLAGREAAQCSGSLEIAAQTTEKAAPSGKERMSPRAQLEKWERNQSVLTQALSFFLSKVE